MVDHVLKGFPEGCAAGEDDERTDTDEHGSCGELAGEAGRDRGGDDTAGDQSGDVHQRDAAEQDEKGDRAGENDEEFGQANGADHIAWILSFGDQGAGDQGTPASTGEGVHKAADGSEPASPSDLVPGFPPGKCFSNDIIAEIDRIDRQGDTNVVGVFFPEIGEGGAEDGADYAGNDDRPEQFLIDVAEAMVAVAGNAAGEDAGGMYAAADDGRADAIGEEEGGRDGAVAQTHRAVDKLCEEAGQRHNPE